MFKKLFISNYIQNKTTFISYGYLKNELYPMYNITIDGDLIEDESIDERHICINYDYINRDMDIYDIYRDIEECLLNEELMEQIDKLLEQLNDREETVIRMRFGLGDDGSYYTLDEIGRVIGVSRERVRMIESSAIKKLKHPKINIGLKRYVFEIDKTIKDNDRFKFIADFFIDKIKYYNNHIRSKYLTKISEIKIIDDVKINRIASEIIDELAKLIKNNERIYIDTSNKDNIISKIFRGNCIYLDLVRTDMLFRIDNTKYGLEAIIYIGDKKYTLNKHGKAVEI